MKPDMLGRRDQQPANTGLSAGIEQTQCDTSSPAQLYKHTAECAERRLEQRYSSPTRGAQKTDDENKSDLLEQLD